MKIPGIGMKCKEIEDIRIAETSGPRMIATPERRQRRYEDGVRPTFFSAADLVILWCD